MTTRNRVLLSALIIGLLAFISACEKPVDGSDPIPPTTTEPILISYFSALEQVLYYAEEHWEGVVADGHLLEASATGSRYSGYTLKGEPQIYDITLEAVPQAELIEISKVKDLEYEQILLDIHPAEAGLLPARSRSHYGLKCGETFTAEPSCKEVNDSTSVQRIYNEFRRCEKGVSTDSCTEFNVVWFTWMQYNAKQCELGGGTIVAVGEEKDWRCYQ